MQTAYINPFKGTSIQLCKIYKQTRYYPRDLKPDMSFSLYARTMYK